MELRGHGDDHVIVVWVEVTSLWHVKAEGRGVVVTGKQVVRIVRQAWLVSGGLGQIRRPHTLIGILRLMDGHVGSPDSVTDDALAVVPLLEVVTSVFLMSWVDLGEEDHLLHELTLSETFIDEQVVFLMDCTVAALACSAEHLETSAEPVRI